jgi:hypothetical protein
MGATEMSAYGDFSSDQSGVFFGRRHWLASIWRSAAGRADDVIVISPHYETGHLTTSASKEPLDIKPITPAETIQT